MYILMLICPFCERASSRRIGPDQGIEQGLLSLEALNEPLPTDLSLACPEKPLHHPQILDSGRGKVDAGTRQCGYLACLPLRKQQYWCS